MTNDKKVTVKEVGMKKSLPKKEVLMMLEKTAEVSYDAGKKVVTDMIRSDVEKMIKDLDRLEIIHKRQEKLSFWIGALSVALGLAIGQLISVLFF